MPATKHVVRRSDEWEKEVARGEGVRSVINQVLIFMMSQSATAPEKMRMNVKLAASMLVCFSANRQSSELLANAIMASSVSVKTCGVVTGEGLAV